MTEPQDDASAAVIAFPVKLQGAGQLREISGTLCRVRAELLKASADLKTLVERMVEDADQGRLGEA